MRASVVVLVMIGIGCRSQPEPPAFAAPPPPASAASPRVVQLQRGDPPPPPPPDDRERADERNDRAPPRPCREVEDFDGNRVCADPPGADAGFVAQAHPCPSDVRLPGARPVRVRFIGLTLPGQGDCGFGSAVLRSLDDARALQARVPAGCWSDAADALLRVDYARFEAAVLTHTDHDGIAVRLAEGNVVHEVIGPGACKGTAPLPVTTIVVRPRTNATVRTHRCPRHPCLAP